MRSTERAACALDTGGELEGHSRKTAARHPWEHSGMIDELDNKRTHERRPRRPATIRPQRADGEAHQFKTNCGFYTRCGPSNNPHRTRIHKIKAMNVGLEMGVIHANTANTCRKADLLLLFATAL